MRDPSRAFLIIDRHVYFYNDGTLSFDGTGFTEKNNHLDYANDYDDGQKYSVNGIHMTEMFQKLTTTSLFDSIVQMYMSDAEEAPEEESPDIPDDSLYSPADDDRPGEM